MKFISSYWNKLGINRKFSMIFVLLFFLIVFMAISAWLSFISIRHAEDDIRRSTKIGHQVLEMDRGLERARRLLDDFFLTYKSIGLQKAHVQYAQPSVRQISRVISLSSDLEKQLFHSQFKATSNIDPTDINLYLASAKRFADTSITAVELISKRAAPEWGLETRLENILVDLSGKLSEVQSLARLQNQVVTLYKDYQLRGQRPLMQSVFNTQSIIKTMIVDSPQFSSASIDHILGLIEHFQVLANELLNLDREILSKMNDFYLQEVGISPISAALVEAVRQEVVKTQREVDKVYKTAGFLLITFAAISLLIMLFVAKTLRQTITNNIIKLAGSAQDFGQGNMEIRLEETSKDELGQLAKVFNEMAEKLQEFIANLEEKVATRTAELAQSEARFRKLLNDLPKIAVQGYNQEHQVTYWNQTSEKLYGFTGNEVIGKKIKDLPIFSAERKEVAQSFSDWFNKGIAIAPAEHMRRNKSGIEIPVYSAQVMLDTGAEEKMIYSVDIDLSDLKLAQAMEQQIETFYLQLFNHSSSGIIVFEVVDGFFVIKNMNPASLALTKFCLEEVVGEKVTEVFSGVNEMGLLEVFKRVHSTGLPESMLATLYEGSRQSFYFDSYVYKLATGEIVIVYDDVTQRKLAEDLLLKRTEEWEKTFDAIPDFITLQDGNMRIKKANRATLDYFGMSPEEIIGKTCHSLFHGTDEPCEVCPIMGSTVNSPSGANLVRDQKHDKVFQVSLTPVTGDMQGAEAFVHVARDITKQLRLEEELAQSQKVEAIGSLAGGIAHDFNNILMAIVGYAGLAGDSIAEGHPARDDIREILTSAERAAALVKQILTYSRKQEHQLKKTDPYIIVKEALQMLKPSIPATIEILEDLDEKSGEIIADPTNIHQILINLCTNALHAIEDQKGTITIRLYSMDDLPDNTVLGSVSPSYSSFVVLSVVDTGHGMEPSTLQRIFDPYFTTKEVGKGSGMGLAVVHGIVQELNGRIDVDSEPGKGTTISVYIPKIDPTDSTIEAIVDVPQLNFIHEHQVKRVLVVDDEPLLVKLHKRQLERVGYAVTTATDSIEALRRFTENPQSFDLLITDQTMPRLSGAELSRAILGLRPDLPIIMCTGHSDIVSEDDALSFGIRKYVLKPIQGNELLEAVLEVTGNTSTRSA